MRDLTIPNPLRNFLDSQSINSPREAHNPLYCHWQPFGEDALQNSKQAAAKRVPTLNAFLIHWLSEVGDQEDLSPSAKAVGAALSRFVGIGKLAFANWQKVNVALSRDRMDKTVLADIRELQEAGYLGRFQGNRYNQSRGWSLLLPEGEVVA